ncbi:MAG: HD domain-containing protein [Clostridia bacterium]|nr:HD domain-containing protein [Clostridia bacterium]
MNNSELKNLVTPKTVRVTVKNLTELHSIYRWSSCIADYRFNELNKQAMNAGIAYILAHEAQEVGKDVNMTKLPKIIMHRVFEKLFLCDIREDYLERILRLGNISRADFDNVIETCIEQEMGKSFADFIDVKRECFETRIFQAAVKLATKMELFEIRRQIPETDYISKVRDIDPILLGFSDIPGFAKISHEYSKEMILFRQISGLRNRIRWNKRLGAIKCSVLGHNFEVAVIAYLMALHEYGDERIATDCFFIGLFHDLPETFTGDMPKPVKDAIPGLRRATELFELEMVRRHIYEQLPEHLKEAMHDVMVEEEEGKKEEERRERHKDLIKRADYLSADLECARNIIAGSIDPYFQDVINKDLKGNKLGEIFSEVLVSIMEDKSF